MAKTVTYRIAEMRVNYPKGKVAEKNPTRFATVKGIFSDAKGNKLSFTSKNVTLDEAKDKATVIDPAKGILTLPAGEKGRKKEAGESAESVAARLAALRG